MDVAYVDPLREPDVADSLEGLAAREAGRFDGVAGEREGLAVTDAGCLGRPVLGEYLGARAGLAFGLCLAVLPDELSPRTLALDAGLLGGGVLGLFACFLGVRRPPGWILYRLAIVRATSSLAPLRRA